MKKFAMLLGLLLSVGLSSLALAVTLDEAKAQGLVGEQMDGYIGAVVPNPSAEVRTLITTTNDGRGKVYADLAQRNSITIEAVGILSAEKLRASDASGEYVQLESGQWQRKP